MCVVGWLFFVQVKNRDLKQLINLSKVTEEACSSNENCVCKSPESHPRPSAQDNFLLKGSESHR